MYKKILLLLMLTIPSFCLSRTHTVTLEDLGIAPNPDVEASERHPLVMMHSDHRITEEEKEVASGMHRSASRVYRRYSQTQDLTERDIKLLRPVILSTIRAAYFGNEAALAWLSMMVGGGHYGVEKNKDACNAIDYLKSRSYCFFRGEGEVPLTEEELQKSPGAWAERLRKEKIERERLEEERKAKAAADEFLEKEKSKKSETDDTGSVASADSTIIGGIDDEGVTNPLLGGPRHRHIKR